MKITLAALISLTVYILCTLSLRAEEQQAIFAGGCFWCMEKDFDHVPGVIDVVSGYAGGNSDNPDYKNYEKAGHYEVVRITYDSTKVTYAQLLHTFWRSVNPTDPGGQFCDRGKGYSTAIFALDDEQSKIARASKSELESSGRLTRPIVTPIFGAVTFWPAEGYHQDYYLKNPARYTLYRLGCRRDQTIKQLWGEEAHSGINYQ